MLSRNLQPSFGPSTSPCSASRSLGADSTPSCSTQERSRCFHLAAAVCLGKELLAEVLADSCSGCFERPCHPLLKDEPVEDCQGLSEPHRFHESSDVSLTERLGTLWHILSHEFSRLNGSSFLASTPWSCAAPFDACFSQRRDPLVTIEPLCCRFFFLVSKTWAACEGGHDNILGDPLEPTYPWVCRELWACASSVQHWRRRPLHPNALEGTHVAIWHAEATQLPLCYVFALS